MAKVAWRDTEYQSWTVIKHEFKTVNEAEAYAWLLREQAGQGSKNFRAREPKFQAVVWAGAEEQAR